MVDAWYIQSLLYKGNVTYYVPPRKGEKYYGDFAQTMWAKSYMVGCARSRFKTLRRGRLLNVERLVCNIAPFGPQPTMPLWLPDAPTDACPTRAMQSIVWHSLCDYQPKNPNEIISLDPSMTLEDHLILNAVLEIEKNKTLNYLGSLDKLYLAKVARAAIANMYTTQSYLDSVQKSEIMDLVNVIAILTNDSTIAFGPQVVTENPRLKKKTLLNIVNTTVALQTERTTKMTKAKQTKHKLNMIEGPGVYKMEDFTDFLEMTENIRAIEEIPEKDKNYYAENGLIEMTKSKVPNYTEYSSDKFKKVQLCQNRAEGACVHEVQSTNHYAFTVAPKQLLEDVTNERHLTSRRHFGVFDIHMYGLMNDESFSGSGDDDFLITENSTTSITTEDPETVRELQEALARMERDMEPYDPTRKERRDLGVGELEATSREYAETPSNDSDSGDQILKILKLIPSWTAPTESPNIAIRVTPSLVIVLAVRL
ncbi:uncharacterized protein LOC111355667 [Spodoptera litura]|uniref:Uncharacterized protein LOC111355667 n=1 Tax=Spodoptera litura TaxID=69820 RepID=A0A9J7E6Q8_SPOLT|nr:uncharacterized protein LOC111355667 [Spodoptera litura]